MGQEGAGEVAVAKQNDSNEWTWHAMTAKGEEGQLSVITWPPMTLTGPDVDFYSPSRMFGGNFHRGQFTIIGH